MKYVHVFTHAASPEVEEGALHWPWVTADRLELHDRIARARTSAREAVAARIAGTFTARSSTRAAGAKVKRTRTRAASAAASAVEAGEGSGDA